MKLARVFAFPLYLLAALWLPRAIAAWLDQHGFGAAQLLLPDTAAPHFWYGCLVSFVLLLLVHGRFMSGAKKYPGFQMIVLSVVAMSLRIGLASWLHLLDADAVMVDALLILLPGFIAASAVGVPRVAAKNRGAPTGVGWGPWTVYVLQSLLGVFGGFATLTLMSDAAEAGGMRGAIGWIAIIPLVMVSVLFHEAGHYLGARLSGMKVLVIDVMGMECYPRRKGWLVRVAWKRGRSRLGYVYAVHDPGRPMRGQMLWLVAMGPVSSAFVCMLSIGMALAASSAWLIDIAAAFAVVNGVFAVANALPQRGLRYTDGTLLLRWWRHKDDQDPALAYVRLTALSLFGTTADALPEQDIQKIEASPMPIPLVAMWYRLKAAQNRADWAGAVEVGARFEEALGTSKQMANDNAALVAHVRAEVAFSSAMATGRHDLLSEHLNTKQVRQLCPHFWPRCLALRAALDGTLHEAERLLQLAMHEANRSIDLALPRSEAMLARYIMERGAAQGA